ncbi:START-like domain [Plasmopara halstedii]|uniref:START-like domain n=1 Tax=Plasmopara halstedii TaxID=4781 RepID=A0A0P1AA37_PLAHL|nr:START-like domain [Plasmopara halstedii]CEG37081.1 START-like domain [Plasmopara halstedii]|eukprot:XP_024573450.1 START-like domain [Plasmopara halstedii]
MVLKDLCEVIPDHVVLTKEHERDLTDTADRIVAETLHSYETFIASNRQFDSRVWKHVKSREKVHVYRTHCSHSKKLENLIEKQPCRPKLLSNDTIEQQQREAQAAGRPHAYTPDDEDEEPEKHQDTSGRQVTASQALLSHTLIESSSDCGSFSVFPTESVVGKIKPPRVPLVAAIGIIDGSVEDVAFGALAHTNETWFERNAYVKNDGFDSRKVLASFQKPSKEDPFRFVGIKWATCGIAAFVSRRDVLFLESSGIALDWDGERVYYNLAHSVVLDDCPTLPTRYHVVRLNLSICYIMRQIADTQIEVYARGFADMGGNLPAVIGMNVFSQGVVDVVGIVEASYLKKLAWQISHRCSSKASKDQLSNCGVCGRSIVRFGNLLCMGGACAICKQMTCQKCSVQKKLLSNDDIYVEKKLTFCLSCVIDARQMSAWDVALQQLENM